MPHFQGSERASCPLPQDLAAHSRDPPSSCPSTTSLRRRLALPICRARCSVPACPTAVDETQGGPGFFSLSLSSPRSRFRRAAVFFFFFFFSVFTVCPRPRFERCRRCSPATSSAPPAPRPRPVRRRRRASSLRAARLRPRPLTPSPRWPSSASTAPMPLLSSVTPPDAALSQS